jgi:hypothetical protein
MAHGMVLREKLGIQASTEVVLSQGVRRHCMFPSYVAQLENTWPTRGRLYPPPDAFMQVRALRVRWEVKRAD